MGATARHPIIAAVRHPRHSARLLPECLHFFADRPNFHRGAQNLDDLLTNLRFIGDTVWLGEVS
jgi:hypothetical protein